MANSFKEQKVCVTLTADGSALQSSCCNYGAAVMTGCWRNFGSSEHMKEHKECSGKGPVYQGRLRDTVMTCNFPIGSSIWPSAVSLKVSNRF